MGQSGGLDNLASSQGAPFLPRMWQAPDIVALPIRDTARGASNGADNIASAQAGAIIPPAAPGIVGTAPAPVVVAASAAAASGQWQLRT